MPKVGEVVRDRDADYKTSRALAPLEIPPDLSSSTIEDAMVVPDAGPPQGGRATFSEYAGERAAAPAVVSGQAPVLAAPQGIRVARDGQKRWLVLKGAPDAHWNRVREFWLGNGFLLKVDNPAIGIMETDWAENRADIPQGFIRSMLGKLVEGVYSSATRDLYRVRFERGSEAGTTELYLSHRGAEEVTQGERFVWQPRPSDPELEAEMLSRLMVYLGVEKGKAERLVVGEGRTAPRARLVRDAQGQVQLSLDDEFSRAWRRTGLALDRVGFTVEDRDRSRGLYFVRYMDPLQDTARKEGLLSKLKFWGGEEKPTKIEYLVSLVAAGNTTDVVVLNKEGQREGSETATRILSLLEQELK
jgi:outer membrane protein assembly factor BamC